MSDVQPKFGYDIFRERLTALRQAMHQYDVDALIILTSDPHLSEYPPEHWRSREWLCPFTGSAGTVIVTQASAELWTDSRYWTQAEKQLAGSGLRLQKEIPGHTPRQWLAAQLPTKSRVSIDGAVLSVLAKTQWEETLAARQIALDTRLDLINALWAERPPLPVAPTYPHEAKFCGQTVAEKLAELRQAMHEHGANWHIVSALDDIAWLTNTRGGDVPYNPVFLAHLLIAENNAFLFTDANKFSEHHRCELAGQGITIVAYEGVLAALAAVKAPARVLFDPQKTSARLIEGLLPDVRQISAISPSSLAKSCKKEIELTHIRRAMEKDGAALCEFFTWLDASLAAKAPLTELIIDQQLSAAREKQEAFVSASFPTIAAFNVNAAQPHYQASEISYSTIEGNGLLLIDSGAQYLDGTTDITRVVPIGKVSAAQKRDFTIVLKAHIALAQASFPDGIESPLLDAIARAPLWAQQLDFGHGTGHGVGYFLNVHEGPQVFSRHAPVQPQTKMRVGMITSIEPGLYRPGRWGIRIENLVAAVPIDAPKETDFGTFLRFETLSLCPIDVRCIDTALLTRDEKSWLNAYHQDVLERLTPKLVGKALTWLQERTQPLAD